MQSDGLILEAKYSLPDICAPLSDELTRCFALVDSQSGLYNSSWAYESPENEELVERLSWHVPAFASTSTQGLRPGALPLLASRLMVDEWSYYFIIDAPEVEALSRATAISQKPREMSKPYLQWLGNVADLLICHADGWWELYTSRCDWHERLLTQLPGCRERPFSMAGLCP